MIRPVRGAAQLAAPPSSGALARDLLQRATGCLAAVPPGARAAPLAALDRFLAAPGPATYVAAARVLGAARRSRSLLALRAARAGADRTRGLAAVERELGSAAADRLAALPDGDRLGFRLEALALLAAAHRELAERVAGSGEIQRRRLALAKEAAQPPVPPARRGALRRPKGR
jgi:hypothetical protein